MTNSQLIADLVDCLEYKEDMAHVQVIEGKGAVFWETMYALKRAAHEPSVVRYTECNLCGRRFDVSKVHVCDGQPVKSNPAQVATTDYGPAFVAICQWHDCRSTMAEGDAYFCPTHRELAIRNSAPSAAVAHVSEPSNEGSSAATVGAGPPSQRTGAAP